MNGESAVLHRDLHKYPEQVVEASGLYLILSNGRKIIDATGGAAVSCIGHGDERVREVIYSQVKKLDYCHSMFFSSPSSETLARTIIDSTHGQMSKVFIVNSGQFKSVHFSKTASLSARVGSEAMDGAAKLARQYFIELSPSQPQRYRFIAR